MTREEAIKEVKNYENYPNGLSKECRDYIIEALEQETVSRKSYEHEYFLRKEFELKIYKLQRQLKALEQESILDKVRAEIQSGVHHFLDGEPIIEIKEVLQTIDKYKAESEDKE